MVETDRNTDLLEVSWSRAIVLHRQFGQLLRDRGDLIKPSPIQLLTASGVDQYVHRGLSFSVEMQDGQDVEVRIGAIEPAEYNSIVVLVGKDPKFLLRSFRPYEGFPPTQQALDFLTELHRQAKRVMSRRARHRKARLS